MRQRPVVMSVAGSDSGGGAGIQADLRVFSRLGTFGTTVVTALTAQNLGSVTAVEAVPEAMVEAQMRAVFSGFPVRSVKTGMLWSGGTVRRVAHVLREMKPAHLVVDPVMVATSGAVLLEEDAVAAYRECLLPMATVATPNLDEARVLLGRAVESAEDMDEAALALSESLGCAVLLKGGHLEGDPRDVLSFRGRIESRTHPRVERGSSHGTGCILSAAITAYLALGDTLADACFKASDFVFRILSEPLRLSGGIELPDVEG